MTTPTITTTINANAGIIATSLHETVFLSSTGDVLVCTTANHHHGLSMDNDDDYRPVNQEDGFGGNNLNGREDGVNYNSHRAASAINDHGMATTMTTNYINNRHHDDNCFYKQKKSQQRPDVNVQSEEEAMACCCHPEGLCGGDNHVVSVSSHSGEEEATKLRLISIDNNNHSTTSATATADVDNVKQLNIPAVATKPFTSNADEMKNKKGIVACTDSSDNTTHHDENKDDETNNNTTTLSMKTMSTSIKEYDTFNPNANMMPLGEEEADDLCNKNDSWYHNLAGDGNNHHLHQQQSNYNHISPTPIMSFDYSSYYEPSTPEHKTLLFGSGHEKEVQAVNKNSSVGTNGKKRNISMPNLFTTPENHHGTAAVVKHLPLQQQTIRSISNDPIRNSTITQSKKTVPSSSSLQNQQELSSPTTNSNNNNAMPLSSVPTFLNHLSQVTITRISAHPQGQHVLLVSNEGMLFSFGSNEHGQLGTGRNSRQHQKQQQQLAQYNDNDAYYVKEPTLITPLLENGGKTVHCAAGVDYSLVVVRTERSRIMNANKNRRRQQQQQQQQFSSLQKKNAASSSSNNDDTTTSTATSTSSSSPTSASLKEFKTAHEQMYAFGCNDNNKLGLLDPEKKQTITNGYESSTRRRRRKNRDSTDSNTSDNIHSSPEPAELISSPSSTGLLDSPDSFASMASTDVYLPRRTALHCEVILKNDGSDYHHHAQQQILHNHNSKVANSTTATLSSLPYGIVSVAAAKHHSAAVVKRPCGSVELYTWGRGEDGQLGLFTPPDNNSSTVDTSSSPSRGWESLCCTSMEHNTDASTLNSLIDEDVSLNGGVTKTQSHVSIVTPHYVDRPTLIPSLSLLLSPEQSSHPPLHPPSKFRPRSPRKNHPKKNSPIKHEQQQLSSVLVESEYVVKVALGHSCTHVVTSTGRWLVFGSNVNGLLALGGNITNAYRPVEVELPMAFGHEKVSSVSIGDTHGIALARSGRAFTWGTSSHDALGLGNKRFVPIPHPVHIPNPLRDTSLNLAISRHLVGESKTPTETHNNRLETEEASSRMTDSNPVAYVHAGKDLSILILRSGSIHTCGVPSGRLSDDAIPTEIFGGIQLWRRGS